MKIAVIGNYATQFLVKELNKRLKRTFPDLILYEAEYNTADFEFLNSDSNFFLFAPEFIIWHESTLGLRDLFYQTKVESRKNFADEYVSRIASYLQIIQSKLPSTKILFPNHSLLYCDNIFGSYYSKVETSWQFQIEKINYLLNNESLKNDSIYLLNSLPVNFDFPVTDYTQVVNAELHFTPQYLEWLSNSINKVILSSHGKFKKCIVLDLDNTLWGGVIGDDGLDGIQIGALGIGKAFSRFQKWLKELKNRGIILAVCSKNQDDIAKSPFLYHSEMVLRLEDIAVFVANWESKADNINLIQKILNIGFDSMVFIDDNPAEREIVKTHIPDIYVPDIPTDPSDYLNFLIAENLFETTSFSENDSERTKQYQEEAKRTELSRSITNMADYLDSLEMEARIGPFKEVDYERIAQLTQRSNQFNLRTIRYSVSDIENISKNKEYLTASVELKDKFGSYGLISIVIIRLKENQTAEIDTWIMSCRVLKRTVENFLMNYIVKMLEQIGIIKLSGEYIPTLKNKLVADLLDNLGMRSEGDNLFSINLEDYKLLNSHINYGNYNK